MLDLGIPHHATVKSLRKVSSNGDASTNGMESHRAGIKRSIVGTFHFISPYHNPRYIAEHAGRQTTESLIPSPYDEAGEGAMASTCPMPQLIAPKPPATPVEDAGVTFVTFRHG